MRQPDADRLYPGYRDNVAVLRYAGVGQYLLTATYNGRQVYAEWYGSSSPTMRVATPVTWVGARRRTEDTSPRSSTADRSQVVGPASRSRPG